MGICQRVFGAVVLAMVAMAGQAGAAGQADAAGKVELVVLGEQQANAEFHEWIQTLNKAGAARVQIRSPQSQDKLGVEVQGTADRPVYVATGMLLPSGELMLPGARFRRSDVARLTQWIADVAENGPPDHRDAKTAFGLAAAQMEQVRTDLAQPVGFSTVDKTRSEVLQQIAAHLRFPLRADASAVRELASDKVVEELTELSCGTALACVLRPAGYCLAPQRSGRDLSYSVTQARAGLDVWPVGFKPTAPAKDVLPALYEFLTVNIQGVSAARAMDAIGKRLKVPLLIDHNALARYGIDLEKVTVSAPQGRTTHSLVLQKILFQARLKPELRVDEAGKPFLWITTIKAL